nr:hypothetical protein 3 [Paracoccaceae bacterium]
MAATSKSQIWTPRNASDSKYAYLNKGIDRPGYATKMLRDTYNKTWSGSIIDYYSGAIVEFQNTMSSGDNRTKDMDKIWNKDDGSFCRTEAYVKILNYQPLHIGSVPDIHSTSNIKSAIHSPLFGYVGIRFEYRWSTGNHWRDCPTSIPYGMLHYLNVQNNVMSSYKIVCDRCSPDNRNLWVDRFVSDATGRQNDGWKGAYYKLEQSGAANQIHSQQLSLVGVSFQIKQHKEGGASHTRSLDLQNLTPIWDGPTGYRPMMVKPKANPYNRVNNQAVPFEIYRKS